VRFVLFCHSLASCWNHGNAHFLRGVARELINRGDEVTVYEPVDGWSRLNLLGDHGSAVLEQGRHVVPGVTIHEYRLDGLDLEQALDQADVVLVHEWTDPSLVAQIGECRVRGASFLLFFHDTHHRALTAPHEIERFDLEGYDGVLAFGEVLREVYLLRGWGRRVFTWHEAADSTLFRRKPEVAKDCDLIWIGNWGDGERDDELHTFLLEPASRLRLEARIHGVRYPNALRTELFARGLHYGGWLPNHRVPEAFARARVTIHVPRRPYVRALPGIPTIRMFEVLACGIPLVSAPWSDAENLFPAGSYMTAKDADGMTAALASLLQDRDLADELARTGLHAIEARHTCRHRVQELYEIIGTFTGPALPVGIGSQATNVVVQ
jgi:spore maturation protein CgeB